MNSTAAQGNPMHPADTHKMRAVVQDAYGSVDAWNLTEIAPPKIDSEEVLIDVRAAGLDRGTWHLMTGRPYLMRAIGFGFRAPKNRVPGLATAGVVVAVGSAVSRFFVGDEVYGVSRGAFAELAAAPEEKLARKPPNLSFAEAAAVPVSATTAMQAIELARVEAGHKVLVIGASGGVGTYAVQIAKARGADVTGVCSAPKAEFVSSIGADHVVDYASDDVTKGSEHYDVIIDVGGNTPLRALRRIMTRAGALVIVGGESKGGMTGGIGRSLIAPLCSRIVSQRLMMLTSNERYPSLEQLSALIADGKVSPALDRTFTLDQARSAMLHMEAGRTLGKVVITVDGTAVDPDEPR